MATLALTGGLFSGLESVPVDEAVVKNAELRSCCHTSELPRGFKFIAKDGPGFLSATQPNPVVG